MTRHTRTKRPAVLTAAVVAALTVSLGAVQDPGAGSEEADLRGVVRSLAGPEAGVWVIAETEELDTLFRKIVVTGDDGRFLVPDLPGRGVSRLGPRLRAGRFRARNGPARRERDPGRHAGPDAAGSGCRIPGQLLVLAARGPRRERVPGHRTRRQRHLAGPAEPGGLGRHHQAGLPALSPDGQPVHLRPQPPSTGSTPRSRRGTIGSPSGSAARR